MAKVMKEDELDRFIKNLERRRAYTLGRKISNIVGWIIAWVIFGSIIFLFGFLVGWVIKKLACLIC